jgi:hypothetical protein
MMPPKPTYPLDIIHRARRLYQEGAPVRDICTATGMGVGTLYYHLDGCSLPRRRSGEGRALIAMPWRERQKLAARLFRAAERQARKIEFRLTFEHQTREGRAEDLAALRELTRVLRDLSAVEDAIARARPRSTGAESGESFEREEAVAVEGRAVFVRREKRG